MNLKLTVVMLALAGAPAVHAQSSGMKGMDISKKAAKDAVHKATGIVTKVDKNKVTTWAGPDHQLAVNDKGVQGQGPGDDGQAGKG
jgi:Cu/Ag efflux protein CusF